MTPTSPAGIEAYIGLLIQVPIVGIFIWYTLQVVDRFMRSLDTRDKEWRDFFSAQRRESAEAQALLAERLGEEIKDIAAEVAKLSGTLSAHEARAQERNAAIVTRTTPIAYDSKSR